MESKGAKGNPIVIECEIEVENRPSKKEIREKRRRERCKAISCALGVALIFDLLVFAIAILSSAWSVGAYAFLAVFVIAPPMFWLMAVDFDEPPYTSEVFFGD